MAVTSSKSDRIASRTVVDREGRTRYHGSGRKGRPSREADHAVDVRLAISELEGAHGMLADIPMTPIERRENRKTAVAKIALAARALDEVLKREDVPMPDTTPLIDPPRGRG